MTDNEDHRTSIYLAGIVLLGLALRLWGINWGLPYQYQTEEYKVIKYALRMGSGDLNPHFFEYPSLYLYFMLFLYGCYFCAGRVFGVFLSAHDFAVSFIKDPTAFYLIGRISETLFGAGIIILTFLLGKKIFSRRTGLIAALFTAVLPSFINTGHAAKGDMAAVFLGLIFWYYAYKVFETGEKRYYILSGIFLGIAVSLKYYLAMMGITLLTAHFFRPKRASHLYLLLALALIPAAFIVGTPYSILSIKEFLNFFSNQSGSFNVFVRRTYAEKLYASFFNLLKFADLENNFFIGGYGLGAVCFAGAAGLFLRWKRKYLLFVVPMLTYWLIVSTYAPSVGYMTPVFFIFFLCGARLVDVFAFETALMGTNRLARVMMMSVFLISVSSAFGDSFLLSFSYSLKDSRTTAKEWIESNIPSGEKILLDLPTYSPPIEMSREQLTKLCVIAVKENNYKKDYFKLKTEIAGDGWKGYDIFVIKRQFFEIGSLPYQIQQAQQVQDLVDIKGDATDLDMLKRSGIKYFIVSSWSQKDAFNNYERLAKFYRLAAKQCRLIKTISPETKYHPGPVISIYEL